MAQVSPKNTKFAELTLNNPIYFHQKDKKQIVMISRVNVGTERVRVNHQNGVITHTDLDDVKSWTLTPLPKNNVEYQITFMRKVIAIVFDYYHARTVFEAIIKHTSVTPKLCTETEIYRISLSSSCFGVLHESAVWKMKDGTTDVLSHIVDNTKKKV